MRLVLPAPTDFRFRRTVLSHGWAALPPFACSPGGRALATTLVLRGGSAVRLRLSPAADGVVLQAHGRRPAHERRQLAAAARRMLNLDLDLREFYRCVRAVPELRWIAAARGGRLLRCPTVWEDLVKLVLTTNCSWAATTRMVTAFVEGLGPQAPDGSRAFPDPAAIAAAGERTLRVELRTGYRAPSLLRLAERVALGRVDPQAWEHDRRGSGELKRELLALPGVGPYVAENLLRLLGRPDGLALDSWLRAEYARVYHRGRVVRDRTIARRYAGVGRWAGLALWCDMTRDWFDGPPPGTATRARRARRTKSG